VPCCSHKSARKTRSPTVLDERLAKATLPLEVLHLHRRVVDEDSHRERQAAKGHQIQRLPEETEDDDRDEERERDRYEHDQRAPPIYGLGHSEEVVGRALREMPASERPCRRRRRGVGASGGHRRRP
jgi:hypothetical protein